MNGLLTIRWADLSGLKRLDNALGRLSEMQRSLVLARAVNHVGDRLRTKLTRTLANQTGLPYRTIRRAIKVERANYGELAYAMRTQGGDISLRYFKPRETRAGVTASPFGARRLFAGDFTKAGRFPNRVAAKGLGGHVYAPDRSSTRWGRPVSLVDSGVIIPAEMVKGDSAQEFTAFANRELPPRVMHEISFMLPGFFD
ncbi:phage tail protein [Mesorhizobium sp. WSM4887]|uniref:phage tail protein n=1 Tax=Mesorhizobium sp. WSM4887 TaxID=3038543 RepID=UPI0024164C42|nr:phage tail protein [Mesorhizobium sp. WSM4887]MDG4889617.1 phage tail protein [Mesorhizobium sp. WSM4887]